MVICKSEQNKGDNKMYIKPQYLIDAENRYKQMKCITNWINNNRAKYMEIVKFAHNQWSDMVLTSAKHQVSIADQIEMATECPNFIAVDVARMVNIHKTIQ